MGVTVGSEEEETVLPYDYLILCTGTQFLKEQGKGVEEEGEEGIPRHVISLSSREQAQQVMDWIQRKILPVDNSKNDNGIITLIYKLSLTLLCTVLLVLVLTLVAGH